MFLMYSIDVPQDRRPWLAYLLFPVIVAGVNALYGEVLVWVPGFSFLWVSLSLQYF